MAATQVLSTLKKAGCQLRADCNRLIVRDPKHALTDALREQIRQHKSELLALLQAATSPKQHPHGKVGRHGNPCPECGDTWQWPTTTGEWLCSWCFVLGRRVVREV
jgi:hypothetical protein